MGCQDQGPSSRPRATRAYREPRWHQGQGQGQRQNQRTQEMAWARPSSTRNDPYMCLRETNNICQECWDGVQGLDVVKQCFWGTRIVSNDYGKKKSVPSRMLRDRQHGTTLMQHLQHHRQPRNAGLSYPRHGSHYSDTHVLTPLIWLTNWLAGLHKRFETWC